MKKTKTYLTVVLVAGLFSLTASPETEAAAKTVTEQGLQNQVRNGTFASFPKKGMAAGWSFWKTDDSQGKVRFEKNAGVKKSPAAVLFGGNATLFCYVKIQGGETIYARLKTKKIGEGDAVFTMRFQDAAHKKWFRESVNQPIAFSKSDEWTVVELVVKAPAGAETAVPMYGIKNIDSPASRFICDDVELYILPEPAK